MRELGGFGSDKKRTIMRLGRNIVVAGQPPLRNFMHFLGVIYCMRKVHHKPPYLYLQKNVLHFLEKAKTKFCCLDLFEFFLTLLPFFKPIYSGNHINVE